MVPSRVAPQEFMLLSLQDINCGRRGRFFMQWDSGVISPHCPQDTIMRLFGLS